MLYQHASVLQGVPLIALQECGPKTAAMLQQEVLGDVWEFHAPGTEDTVATFWDSTVAARIVFVVYGGMCVSLKCPAF